MTSSPLARAFADLDEEEVSRLIQEKLKSGQEPLTIVKELQAGMDIFSESCKKDDYFIADLILSGEIFQQSMRVLQPLLKKGNTSEGAVRVVLGTVKGDIHNLGKDILGVLLMSSGFEVIDLGINIPPSAFVDKVRETGAAILGLSGLITPSFESMKETVQALQSAGLRDSVKVVIGGGVVSEIVRDYTGADAFSTDALEGVDLSGS